MSVATGSDVSALCSKCGDVWHVVVAMVGTKIAKVQCKECGGYHRYKSKDAAPAAAKTKKAPGTTKPRKPRAVVEKHEAPAVVADLDRPPRAYDINETFQVGDRVDHPTFAQGVVELVDGGKITVFFATGRKIMMHGKGGPAATSLARPKPFDYSGKHAGKPVSGD